MVWPSLLATLRPREPSRRCPTCGQRVYVTSQDAHRIDCPDRALGYDELVLAGGSP